MGSAAHLKMRPTTRMYTPGQLPSPEQKEADSPDTTAEMTHISSPNAVIRIGWNLTKAAATVNAAGSGAMSGERCWEGTAA